MERPGLETVSTAMARRPEVRNSQAVGELSLAFAHGLRAASGREAANRGSAGGGRHASAGRSTTSKGTTAGDNSVLVLCGFKFRSTRAEVDVREQHSDLRGERGKRRLQMALCQKCKSLQLIVFPRPTLCEQAESDLQEQGELASAVLQIPLPRLYRFEFLNRDPLHRGAVAVAVAGACAVPLCLALSFCTSSTALRQSCVVALHRCR